MSFAIHSASTVPIQQRRRVKKQPDVVLSNHPTATNLSPIIEVKSRPVPVQNPASGEKGDMGIQGNKGDQGIRGKNGSPGSVGSTAFLWSDELVVEDDEQKVLTIPYIASKHTLTSMDLVFIGTGTVMVVIKSLWDSNVVAEFTVTCKDEVSTYTHSTFSDLPETNGALTMSVSTTADNVTAVTLLAATFTM